MIYNGRTPTLFNPHVSKEDIVMSVGGFGSRQAGQPARSTGAALRNIFDRLGQDPDGNSQLSLFEAAGERKVNINFKTPADRAAVAPALRTLLDLCGYIAL